VCCRLQQSVMVRAVQQLPISEPCTCVCMCVCMCVCVCVCACTNTYLCCSVLQCVAVYVTFCAVQQLPISHPCACVCRCAGVCECARTPICKQMYVNVCIHLLRFTCVYMYTNVCIYTNIRVCLCVCVYVCARASAHAYRCKLTMSITRLFLQKSPAQKSSISHVSIRTRALICMFIYVHIYTPHAYRCKLQCQHSVSPHRNTDKHTHTHVSVYVCARVCMAQTHNLCTVQHTRVCVRASQTNNVRTVQQTHT